jgi:endonuclease/exonuclease/phosphatase family metal-dependent hydrolase
MPAALRALAPDVICLQETWTEGVRKALVDGLAPEWKPAAARGGGLLLLSRWPTSDATFTPYPVPPGLAFVERLAGKGVLAVTVATPAGPLRVLDTHCTAFDRASRNVQIKHLVTTLLPHETDLPMVLAGDFNMSPLDSGPGGVSVLDPAYASITAFGFEDALAPTRLPDGTWAERELGTFGGWPRPGTEDEAKARSFVVDHVFVRGRSLRLLSARVELWTRATALSDHNLLCADLALSR